MVACTWVDGQPIWAVSHIKNPALPGFFLFRPVFDLHQMANLLNVNLSQIRHIDSLDNGCTK